MSEELTMSVPVLGLRPYVLIEFEPDPDSEVGFKMLVDGGGGISSADDVAFALKLALTNLPAQPEEDERD